MAAKPPPPPPGRPPKNAPWLAGAQHSDTDRSADGSSSDEDEDDLDWSRGEKVLSDDGSLSGRRLARDESMRDSDDERRERRQQPRCLDDFELEVRGGGSRPSAFRCAGEDEGELTQLPWELVLLRLGAPGLSEGGRALWWDCLRHIEPGDVVRLRCANSRTAEWGEGFLQCASA
eukprot:2417360-Prymnesium_polylepis.2